MAGHARYAQPEDIRRNVVPGELFSYWRQATIAAELGCSERQVRRGVRSLREAGALDVRRRVRPCEASYVWVLPVRSDVRSDGAGVRSESAGVLSGVRSDVLSGVRSHTEPRTEPQKNHEGSSRARVGCPDCGHKWPAEDRDGRSYGTECYKCSKKPKVSTWTPADDKPKADVPACTCGDAYRNAYRSKCLDCDGTPSAAQRDALREKDGCRGEDDRAGEDGGVVRPAGPGIDAPPLEAIASTPPRAETETRQPTETRGQRPDSSVLPEDGSPPNGGEPGPNARRFFADFAQWTVGKRTRLQHGSDRRRLARTARHELADLAKGEQADDGHTTT